MPRYAVTPKIRARARTMRALMTQAELKLWNELRAHRLMGLGFRRQVPVGNYIVDFACPKHRLIIEVDGADHATPDQLQYDQQRTRFLNTQGWHVIRFWNHEVSADINGTCQHILAYLSEKGVRFG